MPPAWRSSVIVVSLVGGALLAVAPGARARGSECADSLACPGARELAGADGGEACLVADATPPNAPLPAATAAEFSASDGDGALASVPAAPGYRFPTRHERITRWGWNAVGPFALSGSLATGAWGQWVMREPPEWARDGRGFARRAGVAQVTTTITETSFAVLSAAERQDARYYRCPSAGLRPRLVHALRMTFVARRADGSAAFSVARTASPFVGPLVTRTTLYPARYGWSDGLLSGAFSLLMNAGWNLAYEFVLKSPAW